MKRKNISIYLISILLGAIFHVSCTDNIDDSIFSVNEENNVEGIFVSTPPELDVNLLRSTSNSIIQENITEQGVSVKISERPWIGSSIEDQPDAQLRSTWDDITWDKDYASIGVFTVKSSDIDNYNVGKDPLHIKCFPFIARDTFGVWMTNNTYYIPTGNGSSLNPYNYHNANLRVNARETIKSNSFFEHSGSEEINFYGYFPYQHQTAAINFTTSATSICKVLRADLHVDNLLSMPYTFSATQSATNIKQHDVMYSVSEDAYDATGPGAEPNDRNRYGNRRKKRHGGDINKNDNVHMRFVHSFCRLQFKISAGAYRADAAGAIKLSSLSIIGSKAYVDGNLNLIEGIVTPGNASTIYRALDNGQQTTSGNETYVNLREKDLIISMLVQPTGIIETLEDFKIVCMVDGVRYTCSLSKGVELRKNHVYDVNLVLSPETKVIVSSGGGSTIGFYEAGTIPIDVLNNVGEINATFADRMEIKPNAGWQLFKVKENGTDINISTIPYSTASSSYLMPINRVENETKMYDVICIPLEWYVRPNAITMHLDGLRNSGFTDEGSLQQILPVWKDISYNGNDGILYNFNLTQYCNNVNDTETLSNGVIPVDRSGWDKKGLKCDGKDDVVAFPGKINNSEYTVSIYLCVARALGTQYHRIVSSGNNTARGFPSVVLNNNSTRLRIFGHNMDESWDAEGLNRDQLYTGKTTGVDIVQIDYVYKSSTGILSLYVDGVKKHERSVGTSIASVPWAAFGGRLSDISRQIHATYYNFMVYDVALEGSEIMTNYKLNAKRYGTTKTGPSVIL